MSKDITKILAQFIVLAGLVVGLSYLSGNIWGVPGGEEKSSHSEIQISENMTLGQIAKKYNLEGVALKKTFGLRDKSDIKKNISQLGLTAEEAETKLKKAMAFNAEESSKNWRKILVKFIAWFAFLIMVFVLMKKKRITPKIRKALLFAAVLIFGIVLGSDPSPMGTIKDAVVLWGKDRIIFPPRMLALCVFLLLVILANKFICSWGCQIGTLQELIFRLNRNEKDTSGILYQYKIPFVLTNTLRGMFFVVITAAAFIWAFDIVHPIDPFVIYKPAKLAMVGIVFIAVVLVASLFLYRPWCTMLCPFGLVGWFFEKISINKIKVNYDSCIGCKTCAKACPSTIMEAILLQEKTIPDCFSCGTCIGVCPTESISFTSGRRKKPPAGKFSRKLDLP